MSKFGGGIYLSNQGDLGPLWDMEIDESGDIRTTVGESELEKDLAYATTSRLLPELGSRNVPIVRKRIRARVADVMEEEERINTILSIEVNKTAPNEAEVVAEVVANDEQVQLIFDLQ